MFAKPVNLLVVFVLASAGWSAPAPAAELNGKAWLVSARNLNLKPNERVTSFVLKVVWGWVESIPHIALDWSLDVNSSPSWQCVLSAGAGHGAGALVGDGYFERFVRVEELPPMPELKGEPRFNIELEVRVFEMPDLNNQVRTIKLKMKDLVLEESQDRGEGNLQPHPRERR